MSAVTDSYLDTVTSYREAYCTRSQRVNVIYPTFENSQPDQQFRLGRIKVLNTFLAEEAQSRHRVQKNMVYIAHGVSPCDWAHWCWPRDCRDFYAGYWHWDSLRHHFVWAGHRGFWFELGFRCYYLPVDKEGYEACRDIMLCY